jgi:hypothetical protein
MKRIGKVGLALLAGLLFPIGIWVAAGSALYQSIRRNTRETSSTCRIDADCPPGYICINGRCVPAKG